MKLSTDYSPFGKFSQQIYILTMLTAPLGGGMIVGGIISGLLIGISTLTFTLLGLGVPLFVLGVHIFRWGDTKQTKELFG